MSSAVRILPPARNGSAADVSALTGLSVETVRRRVKDGSVRGARLDRRVLIPLDAIDRPRTQEAPPMSIAHSTVSAHRSVDARGRALPMTDAEVRERAAVAITALERIADDTDDTDTDAMCEGVERGIDEDRLSARKRFG
jgi:hypothetical protein